MWSPLPIRKQVSLASDGEKFQTIQDHVQHYGGGYKYSYWKDTSQTEEGFCSTKTSLY